MDTILEYAFVRRYHVYITVTTNMLFHRHNVSYLRRATEENAFANYLQCIGAKGRRRDARCVRVFFLVNFFLGFLVNTYCWGADPRIVSRVVFIVA